MKKTLLFAALAAVLMTGCKKEQPKETDTKNQELEAQIALTEATREELEAAVTERDELLAIINDVSSNIMQIQSMENIVSMNRVGEGAQRENLQNNLASIKTTLKQRRQKLVELESKLRESKLTNDGLLATIETLKKQIDEQDGIIQRLTQSLEQANRRIGELGNEVTALNSQVATVTEQRDAAQADATHQADLANICYYAVGTKKELKAHKILDSGFLRSTKVMQGDFDKSYFVQADKRTLTSIPLNSKKAELMTKTHPEGSYEIVEDSNGMKVLKITNPSAFWSVSNYVVVKID